MKNPPVATISPPADTADKTGLDAAGEGAALPVVAFHTLGCKANQLETATLASDFRELGWELGSFDEPADVYVINTCTVTERADQESRRMIRRARLSNPAARVAVTGCYAQVAPEELAVQDGVTFVIGNNFKDELAAIVSAAPAASTTGPPLVRVSEIDKSRIMVGASSAGIDRTRGSLKIQDGCDYKCTYCIIWQARGPSRSLSVADVKFQLGRMLFEGFKEITLTGINIGQYEHESPDGRSRTDLADLLAELISLPGRFRLRLTSLDPMEVTDKLIDVVAQSNGKICPHFHLSAQSADDAVLKRMGRRHHVSKMRAVCERIVAEIPDACIGSDIITGFPGETAALFESTLATLNDTPMHYLHVFSYSARKGTPAADFPDAVSEREKRRRAQLLRDCSEARHLAYRQRFLGRKLEVIVEDGVDEQGRPRGMSENYLKVTLANARLFSESEAVSTERVYLADFRPTRPNDWIRVRVAEVTPDQIIAVIL